MASFTKGYFNASVDIPGGESLVLNGSTTGNVNVTASASTTSYETVLPDAIGTADQVLAISSISSTKAVLGWANQSGDVSGTTYATDLKIGRDADNHIDFATADNKIIMRVNGVDELQLVENAFSPVTTDGATLGSATLEWSDLFLSDGGIVYFGNDQEITLTHVADTGLNLKHAASGDDKYATFTLQTGDTDIAVSDKLGVINFQAPDEGTGTDAILVAAGIEAVSEGDFSATNNATKLSFKTAASEAAAEKMSLSSTGVLTLNGSGGSIIIPDDGNIGSASDTNAIAISSAGKVSISATTESSTTSTGALVVSGGVGIAKNAVIGGKIISATETVTESTVSSIISASPTQITISKSITLFDIGTANDYYGSVTSASPTDGQLWNIMYDDTGFTSSSLRIDFGSSGLVAGSGYAQYLTFNDVGQSASLVYVGSKWRIINTGAIVS